MKQHVFRLFIEKNPESAQRIGYTLLIGFCFLGCFSLLIQYIDTNNSNIYQRDFLAIYVLMKAFLFGNDLSTNINDLAQEFIGNIPYTLYTHPTPHPPTMCLFLFPLAYFDYATAKWIWFSLEIFFLFLSIYILTKTIGYHLHYFFILLLSLSFLGFFPIFRELFEGQVHLLMLLLLSIMWLSIKNNNDYLSGFIWGLCLLLKQISWPLIILFIIHKKYKLLFTAFFVVLLGYLIICYFFGYSSIITYLFITLPTVTHHYFDHPFNLSIWQIGNRLVEGASFCSLKGVVFTVYPLFSSNIPHIIFTIFIPILILIIASSLAYRTNDTFDLFPLFCGLCISLNPLSWSYYQVFSLILLAKFILKFKNHFLSSHLTNLALLLFLIISMHDYFWVQVSRFIESGHFSMIVMTNNLTYHYCTHLLFYTPTISAIILSFLTITPLESTRNNININIGDNHAQKNKNIY